MNPERYRAPLPRLAAPSPSRGHGGPIAATEHELAKRAAGIEGVDRPTCTRLQTGTWAHLAELDLTRQQTARVREALDSVVRERSGESGPAVLTAPINIGIRTK